MADKKKRPSSQEKLSSSRPSSKGSKKSVTDAVTKLTIKALREFRLDDADNPVDIPEENPITTTQTRASRTSQSGKFRQQN